MFDVSGILTMAAASRYYDGETAQVHEVGVRATSQRADHLPSRRLRRRGALADRRPRRAGRRATTRRRRRSCAAASEARLVIEDPELRQQLAALVPAARSARPPAGRRSAAGSRRSAPRWSALVGLFWLAVDYGTEYAAPWLPYSLQAKLGETVFEELVADKDECHGTRGLDGDQRARQRTRPGGRLPSTRSPCTSSKAGRSTPSPCRAASWSSIRT